MKLAKFLIETSTARTGNPGAVPAAFPVDHNHQANLPEDHSLLSGIETDRLKE